MPPPDSIQVKVERGSFLQLACFVGRARPFLDATTPAQHWHIDDGGDFERFALQRIFDHGQREPIFACHVLKTALAARALVEDLPASARLALLSGVNRYLNSPVKQKHVRRTMHQAVALVGLDYEATT